jgi:hypothetical protein
VLHTIATAEGLVTIAPEYVAQGFVTAFQATGDTTNRDGHELMFAGRVLVSCSWMSSKKTPAKVCQNLPGKEHYDEDSMRRRRSSALLMARARRSGPREVTQKSMPWLSDVALQRACATAGSGLKIGRVW